ncbi:MAG: hypothetical protein QW154_02500 [Sulfolobales archaeon]
MSRKPTNIPQRGWEENPEALLRFKPQCHYIELGIAVLSSFSTKLECLGVSMPQLKQKFTLSALFTVYGIEEMLLYAT